MIKLFVSQPMNGKTDEEILSERDSAIKEVERLVGEKVEVIDSFIKDAPVNAKPLWYLAKSIELLSEADIVFFVSGWNKARGCVIEHMCSEMYGLNYMEGDD